MNCDISSIPSSSLLALRTLSAESRSAGLKAIEELLEEEREVLLRINQAEIERERGEGLAPQLLNRLALSESKLEGLQKGLRQLAAQEDPLDRLLESRELDRGLILERRSVPLGAIGMIFESRPDALVQIASLAVKSGNQLVLKGGKEARETNRYLVSLIEGATESVSFPCGWLTLLESREEVSTLLKRNDLIDLMIPRGSNDLVRYIQENTSIPVLGHADGVCHLYVDKSANQEMAIALLIDGKKEYPSACNATETLLIDESVAETLLPKIHSALRKEGITPFGDEKIAKAWGVKEVSEWHHEYGDLSLSVKIVGGVEEAIEHINRYGSKHTDSIVCESETAVKIFRARVDSANLFHNCSTRFSDGYRYGLGAEVGISTSKVHARGPVGVEGLLTYQWQLSGAGQTVEPYTQGRKSFTHRVLKCD